MNPFRQGNDTRIVSVMMVPLACVVHSLMSAKFHGVE